MFSGLVIQSNYNQNVFWAKYVKSNEKSEKRNTIKKLIVCNLVVFVRIHLKSLKIPDASYCSYVPENRSSFLNHRVICQEPCQTIPLLYGSMPQPKHVAPQPKCIMQDQS